MAARFDSPQLILTGGGCRRQAAEVLSALDAHQTLLVVDPYFMSADFVMEIRSGLYDWGIGNEIFTDLQPDPTDSNVLAGTERFHKTGADSILAIGGGSALDTAKMIGVASTNDGPLSLFQGYHRIPKPGAPLVAIPTTAGTGSEATKVAVITDNERNVKMMILDARS